MARFTVVTPTIGRPTLQDSLLSCDSIFIDEIIVSPDGRQAHEAARQIIDATRLEHTPVSLLEPIGESRMGEWGHPQRNKAMTRAVSPWLLFLDDDDVFVPQIFARIIMGLGPYRPHLFRMRVHAGNEAGKTLWETPELREGNVGTPMFVIPNRQLGWWPSRRAGDYSFMAETCVLQGEPVFVDLVIAEVRPA